MNTTELEKQLKTDFPDLDISIEQKGVGCVIYCGYLNMGCQTDLSWKSIHELPYSFYRDMVAKFDAKAKANAKPIQITIASAKD